MSITRLAVAIGIAASVGIANATGVATVASGNAHGLVIALRKFLLRSTPTR